ncbi:MAG: hypothetical protein KatS3mg057_3101 [Herpetosiphonaceae bacterium]|nr:MAG: hypothetical protein KatS3mg057_3101 [Herpetosiphonaceae bacterium]
MIPHTIHAPADDHIPTVTRVVAALIVPFLVAAFAILYLLPDETGRLFAWNIKPRMTALLMGAGYIAGAYFFVRTIFARRWHYVAVGFVPVTSFASLLMIATLLHWDRFNHGHISFITWVALYATTPCIVFALWLHNRRYDPGVPDRDDAIIPGGVRIMMAGIGALILIAGAVLFIWPALLIPFWPWDVTTVTARTLGAWFVLPGVFGVMIARDRRWSAARLALQSQFIGIALILIGALRAWDEFDRTNPLAWIFIGGMTALAVGIAMLFVQMERRRAKLTSQNER